MAEHKDFVEAKRRRLAEERRRRMILGLGTAATTESKEDEADDARSANRNAILDRNPAMDRDREAKPPRKASFASYVGKKDLKRVDKGDAPSIKNTGGPDAAVSVVPEESNIATTAPATGVLRPPLPRQQPRFRTATQTVIELNRARQHDVHGENRINYGGHITTEVNRSGPTQARVPFTAVGKDKKPLKKRQNPTALPYGPGADTERMFPLLSSSPIKLPLTPKANKSGVIGSYTNVDGSSFSLPSMSGEDDDDDDNDFLSSSEEGGEEKEEKDIAGLYNETPAIDKPPSQTKFMQIVTDPFAIKEIDRIVQSFYSWLKKTSLIALPSGIQSVVPAPSKPSPGTASVSAYDLFMRNDFDKDVLDLRSIVTAYVSQCYTSNLGRTLKASDFIADFELSEEDSDSANDEGSGSKQSFAMHISQHVDIPLDVLNVIGYAMYPSVTLIGRSQDNLHQDPFTTKPNGAYPSLLAYLLKRSLIQECEKDLANYNTKLASSKPHPNGWKSAERKANLQREKIVKTHKGLRLRIFQYLLAVGEYFNGKAKLRVVFSSEQAFNAYARDQDISMEALNPLIGAGHVVSILGINMISPPRNLEKDVSVHEIPIYSTKNNVRMETFFIVPLTTFMFENLELCELSYEEIVVPSKTSTSGSSSSNSKKRFCLTDLLPDYKARQYLNMKERKHLISFKIFYTERPKNAPVAHYGMQIRPKSLALHKKYFASPELILLGDGTPQLSRTLSTNELSCLRMMDVDHMFLSQMLKTLLVVQRGPMKTKYLDHSSIYGDPVSFERSVNEIILITLHFWSAYVDVSPFVYDHFRISTPKSIDTVEDASNQVAHETDIISTVLSSVKEWMESYQHRMSELNRLKTNIAAYGYTIPDTLSTKFDLPEYDNIVLQYERFSVLTKIFSEIPSQRRDLVLSSVLSADPMVIGTTRTFLDDDLGLPPGHVLVAKVVKT